MPSAGVGTYSLPGPDGDRLWDWIDALVTRHDGPVVGTPWGLNLPQIDLPLSPETERSGPGRPRRDWEDATDVALAWDIEGVCPTAQEAWRGGRALSDRGLRRQVILAL